MPSSQQPSSFYTLLSLSLVVIIDALVMGIVFPLMGALFINPHSAIVPPETSMVFRDFLYSLTMGIFFIFTIIGAPFLGDLSDILGRRKVLLLSLTMGGLSCLLAALAISLKIIWLLVFSRALAGLMAGNQPLAQAAIIDVSTHETKARNIGYMTLAACVGFALGPLMGGLFPQPFLIAGALAFINVIGLIFTFKETFIPSENKKIQLTKGIMLLADGFRDKKLREWIWILLAGQLGWGIFFQSISLILSQYHHYSTGKVGLFMAYLAVLFAIGTGIIVPHCLKKFKLKNLLLFGFCMASFAMILDIIFMKSIIMQWINLIFFVLGQVFIYTATLTFISNSVDREKQGWVMGIAAAVGSFAWGVAAFVSGGAVMISLYVPFIIALLLFIYALYLTTDVQVPP